MASRSADYFVRKTLAQNWTAEQINRTILKIENSLYRDICAVAFLSNSRAVEVCTLRWCDISAQKDPNGRAVYYFAIHQEKRKDNYIKTVPIAPHAEHEFAPLIKLLEARLYPLFSKVADKDEWVFGDPQVNRVRGRLKKDGVYASRTNCKLARNLKEYLRHNHNLNIHMFRHARTSYLAHVRKVDFLSLVAWGGWKDFETPFNYLRDKRADELLPSDQSTLKEDLLQLSLLARRIAKRT